MAMIKPAVKSTAYSGGDARTFEHTNANKSFYHNGHWWAVLPNGGNWYVEKGSTFGLKASPAMLGTGARADIAFDNAHDKLWVLNYGPSIVEPHLYRLGYRSSDDTWIREADVRIGAATTLTSNNWTKNGELALGLDPSGDPLIASIGSSKIGKPGLHVAYAVNAALTDWNESTIDPGTTRDGGSNGDSKAVFVNYTESGVGRVALAYSADGATNSWKIATHADGSAASYAKDWQVSTFATSKQVSIDNHISAVSSGETIYIAMKDASNAIWVSKGHPASKLQPGSWAAPVKAVNGGSENEPSRPTLVLDETNRDLYLFYQDKTGHPDDIYYQSTKMDAFSFVPHSLGKLIMPSGSLAFSNPQLPAHNVGADTGNKFYAFASSGSQIWSTEVDLGMATQTVARATMDDRGEPIPRPLNDYFIV